MQSELCHSLLRGFSRSEDPRAGRRISERDLWGLQSCASQHFPNRIMHSALCHYLEVFLAPWILVLISGPWRLASEDFSLVHRSNFLTESGTRNCVTHYFEVFLALRIRVLVAGSRNVTSEDFSFVHRSNFVAESCTPIHRRYRACVTTLRFFSFVILLTSSQQFRWPRQSSALIGTIS